MQKGFGIVIGALLVFLVATLGWMLRDQVTTRQELRLVQRELGALHRAYVRLDERLGGMETAEESPLDAAMYMIVLRDGVLGPVGIVPFDLDLPLDDEPLVSSGEDVNVCGCVDSYSCTSL